MSSNSLSATFLGFPSDQSLYSAAHAAAGPNPLSFSLYLEENKGRLGKDRQRRRGERRLEREKTGRGHAERSCLMRTLDLLQIDKERKVKFSQNRNTEEIGRGQKTTQKCSED